MEAVYEVIQTITSVNHHHVILFTATKFILTKSMTSNRFIQGVSNLWNGLWNGLMEKYQLVS